jgi:hypothetical protein
LLQESKDLERRIRAVSGQLKRMEGRIVADTVTKGKRGKKPLGTVKVEGFPDRDYQKKRMQLSRYHRQLESAKAKMDTMIVDAEAFICSVPDSYIRQILRYRYLDGNSWEKVAMRIGGGNTGDGCRMAAERFLQKN